MTRRCEATNKLRYTNQGRAVAGAAGLMARGRDLGHRPLNVFRCEACGDWHIGHRPIVFAQPHVEPEKPKLKCALNCPKAATERVETPRGTVDACAHHAKRLRDAYTTAAGRAGMSR